MEILKLTPACKDYLWGGRKLIDEFKAPTDKEICAEAWLLSCHRDGESVVTGGKYDGHSLSEAISACGKEVLGTNCSKYDEFPILIKLIDAKKSLSIQVHPDDEYALKHENQYGKTEMWYILDAEEGAFLYEGFSHEITKEEFKERIENNTLTDVLNKVYVKKGDVVFITPGTLHAIGAGILIAEIQQSSNVTYRIYDYGRLGADGKPRQLHIPQSLDVTKLERPAKYVAEDGHLVSCSFFTVDQVSLTADSSYKGKADATSFVSVVVTKGSAKLSSPTENIAVSQGDSLFIPASYGDFTIEGNAELLITYIP